MRIIEAKLASAVQMGIYPVMVEDTSLYLTALHGLPGPLIKWFLKALGAEGVYHLAIRNGDVRATAKTVIGVALSATQFEYFEGTVNGEVVAPRGDDFGWNAIFQPSGSHQTFGEMSEDERNHWSMRRQAAEQLRAAHDIGGDAKRRSVT